MIHTPSILIGATIGFLWGGWSMYDLIKRYRKELKITEGLFDALKGEEEKV